MIDISKVRKWNVRFNCYPEIESLPFPDIIVEEQEDFGYQMPQCCPTNIPPEIGAQITVTLSGHGIFSVGKKQYDCLPGTAFCYRHCDPDIAYRTANNSKWNFIWINLVLDRKIVKEDIIIDPDVVNFYESLESPAIAG